MHCIGSLVMPPSANLVNALISHQQHSITAAVVRLRRNCWQYAENGGHADHFFLVSLKYKIGPPTNNNTPHWSNVNADDGRCGNRSFFLLIFSKNTTISHQKPTNRSIFRWWPDFEENDDKSCQIVWLQICFDSGCRIFVILCRRRCCTWECDNS